MCSIEEADQMMGVMKTDLPASFRITGTRSQANALLRNIESKYFSELTRAKESWQCTSKEGDLYSSWSEVPENLQKTVIRPEHFPTEDQGGAAAVEEVRQGVAPPSEHRWVLCHPA